MKELITKEKNIGIIAIIFTCYAIFHQAFQIIFSAELFAPVESYSFVKIFILYFQFLNISSFRSIDFFTFQFSETSIEVYYFNFLFYALMIAGCTLYFISNYKETKLLLFVFSLIFFRNFAPLFFSLGIFFQILSYSFIQLLILIFSSLFQVIIVIVTYWIIKDLLSKKELNINQEGEHQYWIPASKFTRIVHLVLDLFFCILLLYPLAFSLVKSAFFETIVTNLNDTQQRLVVYLLTVIFRFIYYFIFESIFSVTPAKILTNTIIVNNNGVKASFKSIFKRTLSRFVPFESLSCITNGWHDTWSETNVFQLKKTKFSGLFYASLFLIIAIVVYYGMYYLETSIRH